MNTSPAQDVINARTLTNRYGVTLRTLDRWLDRAHLNFPRPFLVVGKRRYWRASEIEQWERDQAAASAAGKAA